MGCLRIVIEVLYLDYPVDMEAHNKLWDVAHQIVQPVVDPGQDVDRLVVVPGNRQAVQIEA
jgi:uncharacterized ferritin-like protein (DUF455 family)